MKYLICVCALSLFVAVVDLPKAFAQSRMAENLGGQGKTIDERVQFELVVVMMPEVKDSFQLGISLCQGGFRDFMFWPVANESLKKFLRCPDDKKKFVLSVGMKKADEINVISLAKAMKEIYSESDPNLVVRPWRWTSNLNLLDLARRHSHATRSSFVRRRLQSASGSRIADRLCQPS